MYLREIGGGIAVVSCHIPGDHMTACETDADAAGINLSWPALVSCSCALTAATGGCTRPHSAARSAPCPRGC